MTKRPLTDGERQLVSGMFGDTIDSDRVAVNDRCWWPLQPRGIAMAPNGELWFHPQGGLCRDDFASAPLHLQGLFIHEMTHVHQAQRGGRLYLPLIRHPFCRYDYRIELGKPFGRYGIEQQAEIVRHAFLLRRGVAVPGKPPLEVYEALLPFGKA